MDTTRFILLLATGLVIMMLIQAWEEDYGVKQQPISPETASDSPVAQVQPEDVPDIPPHSAVTSEPATIRPAESEQAGVVKVMTDVYNISINLRGGGIEELKLLNYPVDAKQPDISVMIMEKDQNAFYIFQGGFLSNDAAPNHEAVYSAAKNLYTLSANENTLIVPLLWRSDSGVEVVKTYYFNKGSYGIEVNYTLTNNSPDDWSGRVYAQLQRNNPNRSGHRLIYTYTGAIISSPEERYQKISFDDMEDKTLGIEIINGWAAMLQHYFVSALIPGSSDKPYYYYTKALHEENRYLIGMMSPVSNVSPGTTASVSHRLFIGPKTQRLLEKAAPRLELTVDYGSLWFVAKPLFICLEWFHGVAGNWGFAIILVTLLIKIIFYPLSAAGYRSMANMRQVQPKLMAIKDRYKDDKTRLNQAMMDLYKKEKINPLGGCFPILIQIPVFIALYWVLLESIELRQASFILWIQDLSSPDPWYVLPVLMGISMFVQQKLNPAPMDPVQEKVMMTLPFVFTVFFAFFPSGLVLYWVVNNVLSIGQQWMITRRIEAAGKK